MTAAINEVVASLGADPKNQVLVQAMVDDVAASGVVLTCDPESGAPYYLLEYDDECNRTDRVTSGEGLHKSAVIYRDAPASWVRSPRVRRWLRAARELERAWRGRAIEIEVAETSRGEVAILQVRTLAVRPSEEVARRVADALQQLANVIAERGRPRQGLAGTRTIFGQMPDWNPAELIGPQPSPLAASLFRFLISDGVWQEARATMGYRPVPDDPLVLLLLGRPYVDVRVSFNSLLPDELPEPVATALVDAWLGRLQDHPELHDKVEIEVAQTVFDLAFRETYRSRYAGVLSPRDLPVYADRLRGLTRAAVTPARTGSLARALAIVESLEWRRPGISMGGAAESLACAFHLLRECRRHGTRPFAIVARHAFVAEAMLRSAAERGAWTAERMLSFKRSLTTMASRLAGDLRAVATGRLSRRRFLARYGHVRPGSFDVTSLRYDQREDVFRHADGARGGGARAGRAFSPTPRELSALGRLCRESGLELSGAELLAYAESAIVGRERAKFLASRHLSDALECLAAWAARWGLTRDELSCLTLDDLQEEVGEVQTGRDSRRLAELARIRRSLADEMRPVRLGQLLRDSRDLYVQVQHPMSPTFVTSRSVTAPAVCLERPMGEAPPVVGRIVCIESADPGFDWLFAAGIAGLVTKFGGGNSHMAIRCHELDTPAAIGLGEGLFERIVRGPVIELRCGEGIVRSAWSSASV